MLARFGHDEEGGENDDKEETGRDVDEGEEEGDEVRDHPGDVAAGHGPEERGVEVPVDEAVVRSGVEPEEGEEDGGHGQGAGEDVSGRGPLRSLQVIGEEGGGEGDEGHAHQGKYVEEEQDVVGADDKAEAVVVVRPDHADLEEADHVTEIGWPLLDERSEGRRNFDVGNPDLYVTSSVTAMANTPSLKASIRLVSLPADMLTSKPSLW